MAKVESNHNRIYFTNLDAIRWIAALMVLLSHAISPSYKYLHLEGSIIEKFLYGMSDGKTGVSIFFVLSGFLITYMLISEYESSSSISLRKFYIRRILRIWPLYYLVIAFSFVIYPFLKIMAGIDYPLATDIRYHLVFLSNFDIMRVALEHGNAARSQDITWSVSIEEQFYLVWPLLMLLMPKKLWGIMICLVIAGSIVFRLTHAHDIIILYLHSFSAMMDLAIGGLFAYGIKSERRIRTFFKNSSTPFHFLLFFAFFGYLLWNETYFDFAGNNLYVRPFASILFAMIIASQALTVNKSFLNLGNWSFADKWGKYTYGIYLLHPAIMAIAELTFAVLDYTPDSFVTVFATGLLEVIITLCLSKIVYTYYESYFLNLKEKFN